MAEVGGIFGRVVSIRERLEVPRSLAVFARNRTALLGAVLIVVFAVLALFSQQIAPYDPSRQDLMKMLLPPSREHIFGTDELGRDIFSRVVWGTRVSLFIGLSGVAVALVLGVPMGALASYYGKRVDDSIMALVDILLTLPTIVLAITIISALGAGINGVIWATGITRSPGVARLTRGAMLSVQQQDFVLAAKALGLKDRRIILRHILPNILGPLIVSTSLGVGSTILVASGLGFLGLGVQPPTPEWGTMLSRARDYLRTSPHVSIFPGLAIALAVLGFNLLGDGLRDALDPRLRRPTG